MSELSEKDVERIATRIVYSVLAKSFPILILVIVTIVAAGLSITHG